MTAKEEETHQQGIDSVLMWAGGRWSPRVKLQKPWTHKTGFSSPHFWLRTTNHVSWVAQSKRRYG